MQVTNLQCRCGNVQLDVSGSPIISTVCYCSSCRTAGERLATLPNSQRAVHDDGGTPFVLFRKDRVRFLAGTDTLRAYRLTPEAPTRRVVATCCNTPVFLEFQSGHWLSLYSGLWPDGTAPAPQLRTQTGDVPAGVVLDASVPSGGMQTAGFYARLLGAWIAMGFKVPAVDFVEGEVALPPAGEARAPT